jgi:hypothetical protein
MLALVTRFHKRGDIDDITRAISLHRDALTLRPLGHSSRDTTLNNLALSLDTRYDKMHVSDDLNEAIDRYRESLRLAQLDDPERHKTLHNPCSSSHQPRAIENFRLASGRPTQGFPRRIKENIV